LPLAQLKKPKRKWFDRQKNSSFSRKFSRTSENNSDSIYEEIDVKTELSEIINNKNEEEDEENNIEGISRSNVDAAIVSLKTMTPEDIEALSERLQNLLQSDDYQSLRLEPAILRVSTGSKEVYLLGRYRKLSRQVSQTCWTVSDGTRRGRGSVEEIIALQVCATLRASTCRMHACGREDIDVRCLG
jgi:hypothetical protein